MEQGIKKVAAAVVAWGLASVLVACGGGQAESNSSQVTPSGSGNAPTIAGDWTRCEDHEAQDGTRSSTKDSFTLIQTSSTELMSIGNSREYTGWSCTGNPIRETPFRNTITLQEGPMEGVRDTPQRMKKVEASVTSWGWIALKDDNHLGILTGAPSQTEAYPVNHSLNDLILYTRLGTP